MGEPSRPLKMPSFLLKMQFEPRGRDKHALAMLRRTPRWPLLTKGGAHGMSESKHANFGRNCPQPSRTSCGTRSSSGGTCSASCRISINSRSRCSCQPLRSPSVRRHGFRKAWKGACLKGQKENPARLRCRRQVVGKEISIAYTLHNASARL